MGVGAGGSGDLGVFAEAAVMGKGGCGEVGRKKRTPRKAALHAGKGSRTCLPETLCIVRLRDCHGVVNSLSVHELIWGVARLLRYRPLASAVVP